MSVGSSRIFSPEEWADHETRVKALREARRSAKRRSTVIFIKVKTGRAAPVVVATIDARYWMMDPKDFIFPEPPDPKKDAKKDARRDLAKKTKAPSFLF